MSKYKTEAEVLETSRIRFENTKNQPIIAENMAKYGYNEAKLTEGAKLLETAEGTYNFKKQEDHETKEINEHFKALKTSINTMYSKHREIAKIAYKKEPDVLLRLDINGKMPEGYVKWVETIKTFYVTSIGDQKIQAKLATLAVTGEELNKQKTDLEQLEHDRADYVREKGESQDATSQKDNAFDDLKEWMSEFKAVAKIALADHPQLLEALRIKA